MQLQFRNGQSKCNLQKSSKLKSKIFIVNEKIEQSRYDKRALKIIEKLKETHNADLDEVKIFQV